MDFQKIHSCLYSGTTKLIGEIHKLFVIAENNRLNNSEYKNVGNVYRWWIKEKEENIDELEEKSNKILNELEILKDNFKELKNIHSWNNYNEVILKIKDFCDANSNFLKNLYNFVLWLHNKNPLAVYMLYDGNIWRSDKNDKLSRGFNKIPENDENFNIHCIEFAVGVENHIGYIYKITESDVYSDYYEHINPEFAPENPPDLSERILIIAADKIIMSFNAFFSYIRKCLRKILEKIDEYWNKIYPEVKLESQILEIKINIIKKIISNKKGTKQFKAILDNLLSFYSSHQIEPKFKSGQEIDESMFHNRVYEFLHAIFAEKIQDQKKVANGKIDFLIYNYPVDVKVEDSIQDIEKIFQKHKNQIHLYCYLKKESIGFLYVYDNTKKKQGFPIKDYEVFKYNGIEFVVILLKGNFPFPSQF